MGARTHEGVGARERGDGARGGDRGKGAMEGCVLYKRYAKLYKGSPDSTTHDP